MTFRRSVELSTHGKGTYSLDALLEQFLRDSQLEHGLICAFLAHTSASLLLMENADPSARADLEEWFERQVPEHTPWFTHTHEGADDMPSHIRMALTRTSETIPVSESRLLCGTWQGLYLFEHRRSPHLRRVEFTAVGDFRPAKTLS